jgi:hypothetical protein
MQPAQCKTVEMIMKTTSRADAASLLRNQFRTLESIGLDGRFDAEAERRVLLIAKEDWSKWSAFKQGGPLPAHPAAPVMLQRVAVATYRLAALAHRQVAIGR